MSSVAQEKARRARVGASTSAEARRAGLKRMRRVASCLLAVMIALLGVCAAGQVMHPWLAWPLAFAEAGTAGALADWYAVVALFRQPLGLPMPHTAIIPKNQARIAESLGKFIEDNFLTPELIVGRLRGYNPAHALAAWLEARENSAAVARLLVESLPGLLDGIDESDLEALFGRFLLPRLRRIDVSRLAGQILAVLTEGQRHQPLLDRGLVAVEAWLTANVDLIKAKFSAASRYTPAPLDAYIVNKFVEGIVALIHEVVATPDHELRRQFDAALREFSVDLQASAGYRRFGRLLLRDCLRHFEHATDYRVLLDRVRERVIADLERERPVVSGMIAGLLASFGESVVRAPAIQKKLNAWWLDLAAALVRRYRHEMAALITDQVKGWEAREVSARIEAEIGRDLQYIRINGTFVGGLAGLLIHTCVLALAR